MRNPAVIPGLEDKPITLKKAKREATKLPYIHDRGGKPSKQAKDPSPQRQEYMDIQSFENSLNNSGVIEVKHKKKRSLFKKI